jgi:hypothetical protein
MLPTHQGTNGALPPQMWQLSKQPLLIQLQTKNKSTLDSLATIQVHNVCNTLLHIYKKN